MELEKLYQICKNRHGALGMDVAHDLASKFGGDMPSDAYVYKCVQHAKPEKVQQLFDTNFLYEEHEHDQDLDERIRLVSTAVNNVRAKHEIEVDIFLECSVNSTQKAYRENSGMSRTVLEKMIKFAKYEILKEYARLEKLV
jgi:hypothetical protein